MVWVSPEVHNVVRGRFFLRFALPLPEMQLSVDILKKIKMVNSMRVWWPDEGQGPGISLSCFMLMMQLFFAALKNTSSLLKRMLFAL